jgi:GDPmannose 4,6-dehydratase
MYLILQQDKPEDFVIATGITTRVREFIRMAFAELQIEIVFEGSGENEIGKVSKCTGDFQVSIGQEVVKVDKNYYRPTEVDLLIGDPTKAQTKLNWKPKYNLQSLVTEMVQSDLKLFQRDKYLMEGGHNTMNYYE